MVMTGLACDTHDAHVYGFGRPLNGVRWYSSIAVADLKIGDPVCDIWGASFEHYTREYPCVVTELGRVVFAETYRVFIGEDNDVTFRAHDSIELTGDCMILVNEYDVRLREERELLLPVSELHKRYNQDEFRGQYARSNYYSIRSRHNEQRYVHEIQSIVRVEKCRPRARVRSVRVSSHQNLFLAGRHGIPVRASIGSNDWWGEGDFMINVHSR